MLLALLLYMRMPEWGIFLPYGTFSVLGWILVGVPIAMAVPARFLLRLAWPLRLLVGAALGPLALLMIFVAPFAIAGKIREFTLANTDGLWFFSGVVSTVSFLVYTALVLGSANPHRLRRPL